MSYLKKIWLLSASFLLVPMVASAGTPAPVDAVGLIGKLKDVLAAVIPLLIGVAVVVFLWGVVRFIGARDEAGRSDGRMKMMWGLIGLFIMISVWGIVNLIDDSLGLDNTTPTNIPGPV